MDNYQIARNNMVSCQILPYNYINSKIVDAILSLPRHKFVPDKYSDIAHFDGNVPMSSDRSLMPASIFARMLNNLDLKKTDLVLDVGCNRGYSTAIISKIAAKVVAIESDKDLASKAHLNLNKHNCDNSIVINSPLGEGNSDSGPYDAIFINGSVNFIPSSLIHQLVDGGRLIAVVNDKSGKSCVTLITRLKDNFASKILFDAFIPPLTDLNLPE